MWNNTGNARLVYSIPYPIFWPIEHFTAYLILLMRALTLSILFHNQVKYPLPVISQDYSSWVNFWDNIYIYTRKSWYISHSQSYFVIDQEVVKKFYHFLSLLIKRWLSILLGWGWLLERLLEGSRRGILKKDLTMIVGGLIVSMFVFENYTYETKYSYVIIIDQTYI